MRVQSVRWRIARRHLNPPRRRLWLRWVLAVSFLGMLVTGGGAAAAGMYFAQSIPPVSRFHIHYAFQDARIYASDGTLLYDAANLNNERGGTRVVEPLQARHDTGNACRLGINRIPVLLQNATIGTEDATFYSNPGFDPLSIVRAAYQNLAYGHIISGASTITQQVVRATVLNDKQTLQRKATEVALAYEITHKYSKRKILWYYLNMVPYGNLAYGAQAAARTYFGINVCRLDLAQAALLAGLPRAPSMYDPVQHRAMALTRLKEVLRLMRIHGYLHSKAQIQAALREAGRWTFVPPQSVMRYPQFVRYVLNQIKTIPHVASRMYKGIDVYTTLDPRLQDLAQQNVTSQINGLVAQHVTDGAAVSLDLRPGHYGWIRAMVGSAHYSGQAGEINMAVSPRQPGSSMKPFNYIWAFTHGDVGPGTSVIDAPIALPDPGDTADQGWYTPTNYDHLFHGQVTVREALANSLNIPAVKVEYYVTQPHNVAQTAATFGMHSLYKDNPGLDCSVCYALTLGGLSQGTRLLEETAAYGVFATGGRTVPPLAIWKVIKRSSHRVIYCSSDCPRGVPAQAPGPVQVVDAGHAYEMTDVLSDNNARCTVQVCEFGLNSPLLLDHPAAAKTGTTNSFTDNWTVGYTPQIVTGVWVGNADRSPMQNVIGITGAGPIWHNVMEGAFHILNIPSVPFPVPADVGSSTTCRQADSTLLGTGPLDVVVGNEIPLCALPDRGYAPVQCSAYTVPGSTQSPLCAALQQANESLSPPAPTSSVLQTPLGQYPPSTSSPGSSYSTGTQYPPPSTGTQYPPPSTGTQYPPPASSNPP